jgi:membrane protein YqaA with SNARE-associated domain
VLRRLYDRTLSLAATPDRAWRIAAIGTLASVAGSAFGYLIGWAFFEQVGRPMHEFHGMGHQFETFKANDNAWGLWWVLIAGITPFPHKVISILSGFTGLNFALFMAASLFARGFRFFLIAALLWKFGLPIREFIGRRLGMIFSLDGLVR